jgi:hypothetical protein
MKTVKFLLGLAIVLILADQSPLQAQMSNSEAILAVNTTNSQTNVVNIPAESADVKTHGFMVGLHYMKGLRYSLDMELDGNSSSTSGKWDVGGLGIKVGYDWVTRYAVNETTGKPTKYKSEQVYLAYSNLDEDLNMLEIGMITSWSMFKSPLMFSSGFNLATLSNNGLGGGINLGFEYIAPVGKKANLRPYVNFGTMFLWNSENNISYRLNPIVLKIGIACSFN